MSGISFNTKTVLNDAAIKARVEEDIKKAPAALNDMVRQDSK